MRSEWNNHFFWTWYHKPAAKRIVPRHQSSLLQTTNDPDATTDHQTDSDGTACSHGTTSTAALFYMRQSYSLYLLWDDCRAWRQYNRSQSLSNLVTGKYLLGNTDRSTTLPERNSRPNHRFVRSLEEFEYFASLLLCENLAVLRGERDQSGWIRCDRSKIHDVFVSGSSVLSTRRDRSSRASQQRHFRASWCYYKQWTTQSFCSDHLWYTK